MAAIEPVERVESAGDVDERFDAGDESFENAAVVERSPDEDGAESAIRDQETVAPEAPPPPLETVVEKINPRTRALLAELFKAEVKTVRRLPREKLR